MDVTVTAVTAAFRTRHMPLPDPGARGREAWQRSLREQRRPQQRSASTPAPVIDFSRLIDAYA